MSSRNQKDKVRHWKMIDLKGGYLNAWAVFDNELKIEEIWEQMSECREDQNALVPRRCPGHSRPNDIFMQINSST